MKYRELCRHCGTDLDDGDILERLRMGEHDPQKLEEWAHCFGWTPSNRKRFTRVVTVQPLRGAQYEECPDCGGRWPHTMIVSEERQGPGNKG